MSDLLLTQQKQKHFEDLISKKLSEEFKIDVEVTVKSEGAIKLINNSGYNLWDSEEAFTVLQDTDFTFNASQYKLTLAEDPIPDFQLERDGW